MGESVLYKCYPFLIHIPLIALIFLRFHRNLSISVISVLSAYLLCTPRKWFGTFVAFFLTEIPLYRTLPPSLLPFRFLFLWSGLSHRISSGWNMKAARHCFCFPASAGILCPGIHVYCLHGSALHGRCSRYWLYGQFSCRILFILSVLSLKFSSEKIRQNGKIFCLLQLPHRHRKKFPSFPAAGSHLQAWPAASYEFHPELSGSE